MLQDVDVQALWALVVLLIVVGLIGGGLTYAILRAARHPQPIMLIIVMSLLTVALVGIYVVVDDNEGARQVVATMAATALGALVTATASTFRTPAGAAAAAQAAAVAEAAEFETPRPPASGTPGPSAPAGTLPGGRG